MDRQARRGGQRPKVIDQRNHGDQEGASEPADGTRRERAATDEPGGEADHEAGDDDDTATTRDWSRMRTALVGDVQCAPWSKTSVEARAESGCREGERNRRQHTEHRLPLETKGHG